MMLLASPFDCSTVLIIAGASSFVDIRSTEKPVAVVLWQAREDLFRTHSSVAGLPLIPDVSHSLHQNLK